MSQKPFDFIDIAKRPEKPRREGLTVVIDQAFYVLGPNTLRDLMATVGEWTDFFKLATMTARLQSREVVEEKIALLKEFRVAPFVGGNFFEAALLQRKLDPFLEELKALGIETLEISSQLVALTTAQFVALVRKCAGMGFTVFAEVGRKDPKTPLVAAEVVREAEACLEAGAFKVAVESLEIEAALEEEEGEGSRMGPILEIVQQVGFENLILEAPYDPDPRVTREFYWWAIEKYGPGASFGNVCPQHVQLLEQLRRGMYWRGFGQIVSID